MTLPSDPLGLPPGDAPDPLLGAVLQDRYRVVRRLGEGGMGVVYEGEHVLIRRRVAIKTLHAHLARNADSVARFHREALAATQIGNEHIIEATDMGRLPDGGVFLVLEFLEGTEFGALIERTGALPLGRVAHIVTQLCDALQAAHNKGVIHRDLKPDNIFLVRRGHTSDFVKVLDFGIAKIRDAAEGPGGGFKTRTGATLGTPYYMPPEQFGARADIDARADIYAIGGILYHALAGRTPYEAPTLHALIAAVLTEDAPPLSHFRPDLPADVVALVHRCLARDRAARPASCAEVKARLAPFVSVTRDADAPAAALDAGGASSGTLPDGSMREDARGAVSPVAAPGDHGALALGATLDARVHPQGAPTPRSTAVSEAGALPGLARTSVGEPPRGAPVTPATFSGVERAGRGSGPLLATALAAVLVLGALGAGVAIWSQHGARAGASAPPSTRVVPPVESAQYAAHEDRAGASATSTVGAPAVPTSERAPAPDPPPTAPVAAPASAVAASAAPAPDLPRTTALPPAAPAPVAAPTIAVAPPASTAEPASATPARAPRDAVRPLNGPLNSGGARPAVQVRTPAAPLPAPSVREIDL